MQKENFLESAPRCNGVHLQGEELDPLEMNLNANQRVVTRLSRTDFFGSRASLTEEKTRRVGGAITESLCALILVENTLLKYTERARSRMRAHICVRAAERTVLASRSTVLASRSTVLASCVTLLASCVTVMYASMTPHRPPCCQMNIIPPYCIAPIPKQLRCCLFFGRIF